MLLSNILTILRTILDLLSFAFLPFCWLIFPEINSKFNISSPVIPFPEKIVIPFLLFLFLTSSDKTKIFEEFFLLRYPIFGILNLQPLDFFIFGQHSSIQLLLSKLVEGETAALLLSFLESHLPILPMHEIIFQKEVVENKEVSTIFITCLKVVIFEKFLKEVV